MICNFKTKIVVNKQTVRTNFPEKILDGLFYNNIISLEEFVASNQKLLDISYKQEFVEHSKIHTLREDVNDRYKVGKMLHLTINSRQENYCQFAPLVPVKHIQRVRIIYVPEKDEPTIKIDNKILSWAQKIQLARNDGFDSLEDFYNWFNKDWTGKLIHLTDFKY